MSSQRVTRSMSNKRKLDQINTSNSDEPLPTTHYYQSKHYTSLSDSLSEEYRWSCKCKGKMWRDDINNECYKCDFKNCINYECSICLRKKGYNSDRLIKIRNHNVEFLCRRHQSMKSPMIKKKPKKMKTKVNVTIKQTENKDNNYSPSETHGSDSSSLSFILNTPTENNCNVRRKKQIPKPKKQIPKTSKKKLTAMDDIRKASITNQAIKDGLKKKDIVIATLTKYITDDKKATQVIALMKGKVQTNTWRSSNTKRIKSKQGQGSGTKKSYDYEQIATYIIGIDFLYQRYENIQKVEELKDKYNINADLTTCYWSVLMNVAPLIYFLEYNKPLPVRTVDSVKDQFRKLKTAVSKYDGLYTLWLAVKGKLQKNNSKTIQSQTALETLQMHANNELRKSKQDLENQLKNKDKESEKKNESIEVLKETNEILKQAVIGVFGQRKNCDVDKANRIPSKHTRMKKYNSKANGRYQPHIKRFNNNENCMLNEYQETNVHNNNNATEFQLSSHDSDDGYEQDDEGLKTESFQMRVGYQNDNSFYKSVEEYLSDGTTFDRITLYEIFRVHNYNDISRRILFSKHKGAKQISETTPNVMCIVKLGLDDMEIPQECKNKKKRYHSSKEKHKNKNKNNNSINE
eukprot:349393_1